MVTLSIYLCDLCLWEVYTFIYIIYFYLLTTGLSCSANFKKLKENENGKFLFAPHLSHCSLHLSALAGFLVRPLISSPCFVSYNPALLLYSHESPFIFFTSCYPVRPLLSYCSSSFSIPFFVPSSAIMSLPLSLKIVTLFVLLLSHSSPSSILLAVPLFAPFSPIVIALPLLSKLFLCSSFFTPIPLPAPLWRLFPYYLPVSVVFRSVRPIVTYY